MIVSQDPLRRTKVISMNLVMAWVNFRSPVQYNYNFISANECLFALFICDE